MIISIRIAIYNLHIVTMIITIFAAVVAATTAVVLKMYVKIIMSFENDHRQSLLLAFRRRGLYFIQSESNLLGLKRLLFLLIFSTVQMLLYLFFFWETKRRERKTRVNFDKLDPRKEKTPNNKKTRKQKLVRIVIVCNVYIVSHFQN